MDVIEVKTINILQFLQNWYNETCQDIIVYQLGADKIYITNDLINILQHLKYSTINNERVHIPIIDGIRYDIKYNNKNINNIITMKNNRLELFYLDTFTAFEFANDDITEYFASIIRDYST